MVENWVMWVVRMTGRCVMRIGLGLWTPIPWIGGAQIVVWVVVMNMVL